MSFLDVLRKNNIPKIPISYDYDYNDYSSNNCNRKTVENIKINVSPSVPIAANINSIKELVDSLNKKISPQLKEGQPSRYRPIDDTGSFSADLFPAPRLTHKCYCSRCGTDQLIDWIKYPEHQQKKLGCIKCRTRIDTGEAYETNNQTKEMPIKQKQQVEH